MAKIKKIKEGTATVYPATIPQAVIDPTSGKSVRTELNEKEAAANKKQTVTNSSTDYPSGAAVTASLALKTDISELNKIYPLYNYNVRVGLDSGLIKDLSHLTDLYRQNLSLLDSTVFLWNGEAGAKRRTSGSNTFASKAYNMANKVQQFGAELVTNGTFTTDTSGWAASGGATLSVDTARLKVTNTAGTNGGATQAITTVAGKTYHLNYTFTLGAGNGQVRVGTTLGGSQLLLSPVLSANATRTVSFVATGTTTYLFFGCDSLVATDFALFDNISVKQMDWVEGTNDAVQTTEANQPYMGGLIAPNEVGKLKTFNQTSTIISNSSIVFGSNDSWSLTASVLLNSVGTASDNERLLFGSFLSQIRFQAVLYFFASNSATPVTLLSESFIKSKIGKNIVFTVVGRNGILSVYVDGLLINTVTTDTASDFRNIYAENNQLPYLQIHNRALSASEIQAHHDFLRLQIPEIEGIAIGNQYWATSNYEGVVAGDGSVIPEVQTATPVELVTDVEFDNPAAWTISNPTVGSISGGEFIKVNGGSCVVSMPCVITQGRRYKINIQGTSSSGIFISNSGGALLFSTAFSSISFWNNIFVATSNATSIAIHISADEARFQSFSVQEVGWSQSTAIYDDIYAKTSGTTAQKELAALKAASMWCYYDNNVNNGAIYGKLYNWYAVKLISLYPPQGYRVPTSADFTQLVNYLGGSDVAGGKLKKEGLTYWDSPNAGATNESGFSGIGNGRREAAGGSFVAIKTNQYTWGDGNARLVTFYTGGSVTSDIYGASRDGYSLRLLRNSPVGSNEKTITSTTIVSDIASTANSTQIPFGYSVASIRLKTTANLTNIKVELWNNFYSGTPTLVSTLITGKTANNTTMVFPVLADTAALLQDGTLRITATGAATFETIVEYNLQKNTF